MKVEVDVLASLSFISPVVSVGVKQQSIDQIRQQFHRIVVYCLSMDLHT